MNIKESILARRSVYPKDFIEGAKIDDGIIKELLELATWAPTHKLTQPWKFVVYKGDGVKQFFEKQAEIYKEITLDENIAPKKLEKYALKAQQVSHVIAIIAEHNKEDKIPEIEETVATSCALQNIYLSLAHYGIAGYLSTGNICYSKQMSEFLQLEQGDKCLGFFQLGVPVEELKTYPRKRISAKDKTQWVS